MNGFRQGVATRDAYGEAILALGREDPRVYVVDCDVGKSCKTTPFAHALPEQYVNVGIAEQNACGIAAGLAACGKIPFVTTYAVFGSMRMLEQIRQVGCYPRLSIKIACSHGGFTPANDGATHQGIEDLGILRTLPNIAVTMGCDAVSTRALVHAAVAWDGPVYLRFTRDPVPCIYPEGTAFAIGRANCLRQGDDAAIIANGDVLSLALETADALQTEGISARVLDMHTIKPLDRTAVEKAVRETGRLVTVEDHTILNGLGSAVCEVAAELGMGRVIRLGIQDRFGESAAYARLLEKNGVTAGAIAAAVKALL